jgi:predicted nucleic acid-binding protein
MKSMTERSFVDTNILVYTDDQQDGVKRERALQLLEQLRLNSHGVVSTQVLQEYFVAATRKLSVEAGIARRKVELFSRMDVVQITPDDILHAIDIHRLNRLSFWDALIVHAARSAGCSVLYSEDMSNGAVIAGVRVLNPFA